MTLSKEVQEILYNAEAKALATFSNKDINVVPVSSAKIVDDKIWLIDYFFDKTRTNIKQNPNVSFTFWIGLRGYQTKAKVNYLTKGTAFDTAVDWIATIHPNRIVKGLLILNITAIYDISIHNKQI